MSSPDFESTYTNKASVEALAVREPSQRGLPLKGYEGAVAHLVERQVRNLKVAGSSPVGSIKGCPRGPWVAAEPLGKRRLPAKVRILVPLFFCGILITVIKRASQA